MPYSISQLNQMSQEAFIDALGAVFEDTPAIARQVWQQRPFKDTIDLHQTMVQFVKAMSQEEQLALICAHPDLGSRTKMAATSVQEQTGVGLNQLTPQEHEHFHQLNRAYKEKFGFPFLIAVKNHTKTSILKAFADRLGNTVEGERKQAIAEITEISKFRLTGLIEDF